MPFHSRDNIAFYWEGEGEGDPVIFSHGLGANLERVRKLLSAPPGWKLIRYDNRNHGRTTPAVDAEALSFAVMADDMADLAAATAATPIVAAGVSMGAAIAVAFALRYPGRVRALILNRPAWLSAPNPPNLEFAPRLADAIEQEGAEGAFPCFLESSYARQLQREHPFFLQILREVYALNPADALCSSYRGIVASSPFASIAELHEVKVPCLVCGCPNDPFHPIEMAEQYLRELPHAVYALLPDPAADPDAHAAAFEHAAHAFLQALPPTGESNPTGGRVAIMRGAR